MTLAELQERREEIVRSLGVTRVQFGERSVEYGRQREALELIDREIAKLTQAGEQKVFVIKTSRGLE
jgi:ribosomal protein L7/L12